VPWRTTAQSVVDACEQSRRNLGVDQIDLYQIHMPDIVQPFRFLGKYEAKDSIYWDGLAECYHRGLVKNVGVCNYGPTLVSQCQEALAKRGVPLASNQIGFSLLGRHDGAQETVDKCHELGIKVLAFYPFAMGLLTGKYSSSMLEEESTNLVDSSLIKMKKTSLELKDLERYAKGDGKSIPKGGIAPLLRTMETIAQQRQKTVAQVALNYIICKGAIPIPGARTVSQLQDNIGSMGWRLTDTEVAILELEADKLGFGFDGAGFKRTNEKFVGYGVEKFYLN
jgi:pyridoxine 4-dehydrogenase